MKTRSQNSCCIGHRAEKSVPRPLVRNQAGVEKYVSGTNLPKGSLQCHQNCVKAISGPSEKSKISNQKGQLKKRTTLKEYKEIM